MEVTIADQGWTNGVQYQILELNSDITAIVSGGGNSGKYYTNGNDWRIYQSENPALIIGAANGYELSSVTITYSKSNNGVLLFGTTQIASGAATAVSGTTAVFGVGNTGTDTNGQVRITKISVTYAVPAVAAPVISGETPFIGSTDVSISTTTDGASIYYTTDESDPTTSATAQEYSAPFTITANTTVKAATKKDANWSSVATKAFTAIPSVATVAELNALENNATFVFTGEALVVAQPTASYTFIKDGTGNSLIYGNPNVASGSVGKMIAAGWQGTVSIFNGWFEVKAAAAPTLKDGDAAAVTYDVVTLADVKEENVNKVVTLKGVTFTAYTTSGTGRAFTIKEGETEVSAFNTFGIAAVTPVEGKTYDIVGAITYGEGTYRIAPIKITKTPEVVAVTVEAADITGDITAALNEKKTVVTEAGDIVGDITINLAENGNYTVSAPIEAGGSVVINGAAGAVIDASGLNAPFIQMSATPAVEKNELAAYPIDGITIKDVTINDVKSNLVEGKNAIYYMKAILIDNSVIKFASGSKHILDFQNNGLAEELKINNSTLWAADDAKHTGRLYQQQGGKKPAEAGATQLKVSIVNSTLYNISNGSNYVGYYRENSKSYHTFEVLNSVIVNCATSGNFVISLNQKQKGANSTWNVNGNIFNFGGVDTSADEVSHSAENVVKNSTAGVVTFTDAASGNFNGVFTGEAATAPTEYPGDPRWSYTYTTGINTISADKAADALENAEIYNLQGQRVENAKRGLYIVNGRKVVIK